MQVDTAVIVVGAGPTGLMLAGELALAGVAIEIVEREVLPRSWRVAAELTRAPPRCLRCAG